MIRSFSLLLGLFGLLIQTVSATPPQDDLCKVEQDHINTAIYIDGQTLSQNLRACAKGTISIVEIIASADFDGGYFDVAILDDTFTPKALHTVTADNYNGTSFVLNNLSIPTLMNDQFTIMIRAKNGASCVVPGTDDPPLVCALPFSPFQVGYLHFYLALRGAKFGSWSLCKKTRTPGQRQGGLLIGYNIRQQPACITCCCKYNYV